MQANEKHNKTHDKLTKELNKLKIDLNNEGNMDTDLTKRWLRSRTIVVPTPRVLNASQTVTVDTPISRPIPTQSAKKAISGPPPSQTGESFMLRPSAA